MEKTNRSAELEIQHLWNLARRLQSNSHTKKLLRSYYLTNCKKIGRHNVDFPNEKFHSSVMCPRCCSWWAENKFHLNFKARQIRSKKAEKLVEKLDKESQSLTRKQKKRAKWLKKRVYNNLEIVCGLCKTKSPQLFTVVNKDNVQEDTTSQKAQNELLKKKKKRKSKDKTAGLKLEKVAKQKKTIGISISKPNQDTIEVLSQITVGNSDDLGKRTSNELELENDHMESHNSTSTLQSKSLSSIQSVAGLSEDMTKMCTSSRAPLVFRNNLEIPKSAQLKPSKIKADDIEIFQSVSKFRTKNSKAKFLTTDTAKSIPKKDRPTIVNNRAGPEPVVRLQVDDAGVCAPDNKQKANRYQSNHRTQLESASRIDSENQTSKNVQLTATLNIRMPDLLKSKKLNLTSQREPKNVEVFQSLTQFRTPGLQRSENEVRTAAKNSELMKHQQQKAIVEMSKTPTLNDEDNAGIVKPDFCENRIKCESEKSRIEPETITKISTNKANTGKRTDQINSSEIEKHSSPTSRSKKKTQLTPAPKGARHLSKNNRANSICNDKVNHTRPDMKTPSLGKPHNIVKNAHPQHPELPKHPPKQETKKLKTLKIKTKNKSQKTEQGKSTIQNQVVSKTQKQNSILQLAKLLKSQNQAASPRNQLHKLLR